MYVGVIHTSALLLVYIQPQRVIGATVYVSCADDFFPRLSFVVLVLFFQKRRFDTYIRVCGPSPIAFGLPRLENIYLYMKRLPPSPRGANAEEHIKTRIQCLCFWAKCIYVQDDLLIPFQPFLEIVSLNPRIECVNLHGIYNLFNVQKKLWSIHLGSDLVPWSQKSSGILYSPFSPKTTRLSA